ncbi:MAG: protein jag [Geodermatophilaceae bacterium]
MSESTTEQHTVSSQGRTATPGMDGVQASADGSIEDGSSAKDRGSAEGGGSGAAGPAAPADAEGGAELESTDALGVDNGAAEQASAPSSSPSSGATDALVTDSPVLGTAVESESGAESGGLSAGGASDSEAASEPELESESQVRREADSDTGRVAEDPSDVDAEPAGAAVSGEALLVQEGEIAGDYLEQLLDILDYDGDIDLDVEGGRAIVAIVGADDLDPLVGNRGVTLDALQELTRLSVAQQTGVRTRLMLDVGGYRAGRRTELSEMAATSVIRVIDSGETVRMAPMNAFERKIVHDVVTATDGVRSESEGEDPDRRVVILPDR